MMLVDAGFASSGTFTVSEQEQATGIPQREIIRLWNRMRRVEGPIAEEIRIQILEYFAQQDRPKRAA